MRILEEYQYTDPSNLHEAIVVKQNAVDTLYTAYKMVCDLIYYSDNAQIEAIAESILNIKSELKLLNLE